MEHRMTGEKLIEASIYLLAALLVATVPTTVLVTQLRVRWRPLATIPERLVVRPGNVGTSDEDTEDFRYGFAGAVLPKVGSRPDVS